MITPCWLILKRVKSSRSSTNTWQIGRRNPLWPSRGRILIIANKFRRRPRGIFGHAPTGRGTIFIFIARCWPFLPPIGLVVARRRVLLARPSPSRSPTKRMSTHHMRPTWAIRIFSTPCATPSCRQRGSSALAVDTAPDSPAIRQSRRSSAVERLSARRNRSRHPP